MKINDIYESTTSGSIATVAAPMSTQKRSSVGKGVYGNENAGNLLTGKKTNKKYANSVNESKMKELAMDMRNMDNGNFQKKYKRSKEQLKYVLGDPDAKKTVQEAHLEEDDVIIVPGQGRSRKTGLIKHGESRLDHEVEMARSDLFSAAKNAKQVYEMIADLSEEEGLEGWVQEKIIKANDYLNTIREYLEGKQLQNEMTGGVIAGGGVGESADQPGSKKLEVYGNRHGFYIFLPNGHVLTANKLPASVQQDLGDGSYVTSSFGIQPDPNDDKEEWDKLAWNVEDAGPASEGYVDFAKRSMKPVNAFNLPPEVKTQVKQFMKSAKR
jgi:hypothetical protein